MITQQQFPTPIHIEGDATFADIVGWDYQGPILHETDAEYLSIVTRTSGLPTENYFREASDGLRFNTVVFAPPNPPATYLEISTMSNGIATELIGIQSTALDLAQGDTVHFTITDNGQYATFDVAKYVGGVLSDTARDHIEAAAATAFPNNYISRCV